MAVQRKTANLLSYDYLFSNDYSRESEYFRYYQLNLKPNTQYTIKTDYIQYSGEVPLFFGLSDTMSTATDGVTTNVAKTITTGSDGIAFLARRIKSQFGNIYVISYDKLVDGTYYIMLNEGSTPLPYEPYGWVHSLRKYGTETDTITTLPAEVIADGNNATVGLVGNMAQSGTPSPSSIIMPSECGERTGNLFDITAFVQGIVPNRCTVDYDSVTNTLTINSTGSDAHTGNNNAYHIPVGGGETISLSWDTNSYYGDVYIFENGLTDSAHLHMWNSSLKRCTLTLRSDTTFIIIRVGVVSANISKTYSNIMLNTGTEPLPYEPYGIKIPILSGGTTTNVYLGEVQKTRKIGKYVFTGEESITRSISYDRVRMYYVIPSAASLSPLYCTHFQDTAQGIAYPDIGKCNFNSVSNFIMGVDGTEFETAGDFKTWLAQQYAAGTPVCVWYVLATPQTAVVNEPLRKIGDYADIVSGISVPTLGTSEQFDVDTTLKPSEVQLTYTGWHNKSDTKF